jgi:hypothetical protein
MYLTPVLLSLTAFLLRALAQSSDPVRKALFTFQLRRRNPDLARTG